MLLGLLNIPRELGMWNLMGASPVCKCQQLIEILLKPPYSPKQTHLWAGVGLSRL